VRAPHVDRVTVLRRVSGGDRRAAGCAGHPEPGDDQQHEDQYERSGIRIVRRHQGSGRDRADDREHHQADSQEDPPGPQPATLGAEGPVRGLDPLLEYAGDDGERKYPEQKQDVDPGRRVGPEHRSAPPDGGFTVSGTDLGHGPGGDRGGGEIDCHSNSRGCRRSTRIALVPEIGADHSPRRAPIARAISSAYRLGTARVVVAWRAPGAVLNAVQDLGVHDHVGWVFNDSAAFRVAPHGTWPRACRPVTG